MPSGKCQTKLPEKTNTPPSEDAIIGMLKQLNIPKCIRHTAAAGGALCTLVPPGCGAAAAGYSDAAGCDQMSIMSEQYEQMLNSMQCVMNKQMTESSVTVKAVNSIKIDIQDAKGCKINIGPQTNNVDVQYITSISTNAKNDLKNIVMSGLQNQLKQAMEKNTGFLGTSDAQKSIANIVSKITESSISSSITSSVSKFASDVSTSNELTFTIKNCTDSDIDLSKQENVIKVQARQILDEALQNSFDDQTRSEIQNLAQQYMKSKAEGIGAFGDMFKYVIIGGVIMSIIGTLGMGSKSKTSQTMWYGLSAVICFALAYLLYYLFYNVDKKEWAPNEIVKYFFYGLIVIGILISIYTIYKMIEGKNKTYLTEPTPLAEQMPLPPQ